MFGWLKHYMPRGLYGRAALILLLPVVTMQLVITVNFVQRHFEGVTVQMTRSVLLELRYLVETVNNAAPQSLDAARNAAFTIGLPLQLDVTLPASDAPESDQRVFYDFSGLVVINTLSEELPNLVAVDLRDERRVDLWIGTAQGQMKVGFDRRRVSASNPHQLLVIMAVLGLLMTFIAYVFLRNQLRPIKRMAAAAAAYGKGRVVPFHPTGAVEVRAAGAAFLDMRNRIERQTQQRTMMLSGVSHDLRTPLTRLRLGLSMMDEEDAAPLLRDVDDMQRLVDAFLDFARGDAGDALIPTDPAALIDQVIADAQRMGRAVTLGEITGAAGPRELVPLRPMAIRRALDNLIGNALRHGTRVEISLHVSDRTIRLSVSDDGPGIAPADREEAMRPFARLDPARNQNQGPGVGLGLAIVTDIARTHGGVLRLGQSAALGGLQADLVIAR